MPNTPTKGRLRPATNTDTEFFWEGTSQHKLLVQSCSACHVIRHPPGPACPHCHSLDWETKELSGRGRIYSFTVVHHPLPTGFDEPAIVAVVELDEGIRMVSNVVDVEAESLKIDQRLQVVFVDQDEGWTAPQFRRVED